MTEHRAGIGARMKSRNSHPAALVLAACSVLLAAGTAPQAQVPNDSVRDVSPLLQSFLHDDDIPGMVALVLRGDRIVARGAAGVRKKRAADRIEFGDQLHLGSCTKAMTSTLVAMLVDEGKLHWTTTLGELFADTVKDMDPGWKAVTLRELLVHRAGLPRGNDPGVGLDPSVAFSNRAVRELRQLLVQSQLRRAPETPPGTREIYSNIDYVIVGAALEKITGRSWEDLMRERIFGPLGITTGGFGPPGSRERIDQPWGHDRSGEPVAPGTFRSDLPSYAGPCGTVHMSITDWARFIALHLRGDPANPSRHVSLLTPESFRQLHRSKSGDHYAPGGWVADTFAAAKGARSEDGGIIFGAEGSNGLWYSKVLVAPEIDLAVLVVCNRGGASVGGKAVAAVALQLLQQFASLERRAR